MKEVRGRHVQVGWRRNTREESKGEVLEEFKGEKYRGGKFKE